jgi:hypothetical protein
MGGSCKCGPSSAMLALHQQAGAADSGAAQQGRNRRCKAYCKISRQKNAFIAFFWGERHLCVYTDPKRHSMTTTWPERC